MGGTITILVDNKAEKPLVEEHGFSVLIEIEGKKLLFDTGHGDALFQNADFLGVSLSDLDVLVLSHGHYDHGGNIAKILSLNPSIQFFAHKQCLISRWSLKTGKAPKQIGLSAENKTAIMNLPPSQRHWCEKSTEVLPGVWVTGEIPRIHSFEDVGGAFFLDTSGSREDLLPDDISLWMYNGGSMTILCGCCHSGLNNTIDHIVSQVGEAPINTVTGGFHLLHAQRERFEKTVSFLNSLGVERIVPTHCTGNAAVKFFQEKSSAKVLPGFAGLRVLV